MDIRGKEMTKVLSFNTSESFDGLTGLTDDTHLLELFHPPEFHLFLTQQISGTQAVEVRKATYGWFNTRSSVFTPGCRHVASVLSASTSRYGPEGCPLTERAFTLREHSENAASQTISATGTAGKRWESTAKPPAWIWWPLLDSHPASAHSDSVKQKDIRRVKGWQTMSLFQGCPAASSPMGQWSLLFLNKKCKQSIFKAVKQTN